MPGGVSAEARPEQGREQVEEVGEGVRRRALRDARPADDQRAAHRVLVQILLAEQPVAAHGQPVVGGVDDHGVPGLTVLLHCLENPPQLLIQVGDQAVVLGQLIADDLRRPRPGAQVLVTEDQDAVVERVLRQEVGPAAAGCGGSTARGTRAAAGADRAAR